METREKLLKTALEVFAERGADGGSMREIARRADLNIATAYHHFGSKRGLLLAIFRELGFLDFDWAELLPMTGKPREKLEFLFAGSWALMSSGSEVIRLAILQALKGDSEVNLVFDEWREQGESRLRESLLKIGLANQSNVTERTRVVRQVIWGTFVEHLMQKLSAKELEKRASEAALALAERWS